MPNTREIIFKSLFTAYYEQLCRFAYRFTENIETARELVQDAYISLWEKGALERSPESLKSFLHTVVKNNCLNYRQHLHIQDKYRQKIMLEYAHEISSQEDFAVEKELQEKIDSAIKDLPEQCRRIFVMNRFQLLKYREIADELGISVKAVEAQISKALQKMKEVLSDYLLLFLFYLGPVSKDCDIFF